MKFARTKSGQLIPHSKPQLELLLARQWLSMTSDEGRAEVERFSGMSDQDHRDRLTRLVTDVIAGKDVREQFFRGTDPRPLRTKSLEHALAVTYLLAEQLREIPRGGVPKRHQDLALVALGGRARESKVERALGTQREAAQEFLDHFRHPLRAFADVAHAFGPRGEQVAKWLWSLRKSAQSSPHKTRARSRGR
jgi:hypothetical protein